MRPTLPETLANRSFTSAEAAAMGFTWSKLRSRGAWSPSRGIWIPEDLEDALFQARALSLHHPTGAISHLTAARIWGFPLPTRSDRGGPIHLTLPPTASPTSRRGVTCHRLPFDPTGDVVQLGSGTRVTTRLRTAADLASLLTVDDLVVVLDHLLRQPRPRLEKRPRAYADRPFAESDDLAMLALSMKGRFGANALRRAIPLARVGSDSPRETQLRLACVRAGLPEPELNTPIVILDRSGRPVRTLHDPDLQWKQYRVVAEYEGRHHSNPLQVERDVRRSDSVREEGWTEVRVVSSDMAQDAYYAVAKIESALRANGWPGAG